jgi:hypothetical protein
MNPRADFPMAVVYDTTDGASPRALSVLWSAEHSMKANSVVREICPPKRLIGDLKDFDASRPCQAPPAEVLPKERTERERTAARNRVN